uniref:Uncharacterized protein n=1 Tax=uncultured bacterium CSLF43 TaxID=1091575 RepID=G4WW32_9BACT|nr:hypothetical protein [uncultured bacterium CSLF43]
MQWVIVLALAFLSQPSRADWNVDFSRRVQKAPETDLNRAATPSRAPASELQAADTQAPTVTQVNDHEEEVSNAPVKSKSLLGAFFDQGEPVQDLVILQTEHGFVPSVVRVRKNGHYRVSVVNVNEKEKNVSFILDAFSEHHATYYGKIKTFVLEPKKEGSFSFESPETSAEGKLIVFNPEVSVRAPSSVGEEK